MYRWILNELPLVSLTHQNILKLFFSIIKINIYFPKLLPFWMDNVIKVVENRWIWEKTAVSFLDSSPSRWNPRGIVRFHGMKGISLNDERWPGSNPLREGNLARLHGENEGRRRGNYVSAEHQRFRSCEQTVKTFAICTGRHAFRCH